MKTMTKKIGAVILAMAMCFSLCATALAASEYTITIENATIGENYAAYKIFDATYDENGGVSYTISSTSNPELYAAVADSGVFTLTPISGTDEYYVTANASDDEIIEWIWEAGIENLVAASASTGSEGAESTTLVLDVGEPGYYYITSSLGAVVTIDTAHPTATVIDKNETVGGEKFYKYTTDAEGNPVDKTDIAMGSELNFDITSNVPLYAGDQIVTKYQFTDILGDTGLEIEIEVEPEPGVTHIHTTTDSAGTVHYWGDTTLIDQFVTLTDSQGITYKLSDVTASNVDYELEFINVTEVEIDGSTWVVCGGFILTYYTYDTANYIEGDPDTFDTSNYPTDLTIDITYATYVTDNADHTESNTAMLDYWPIQYGTIPGPNPDPAETQYSTDYMYDWDLKIVKVDSEDDTKYLDGAEFTLTGENLKDVIVSTTVTYTEIDPADMQSGVTYFYKLADGTYTTTAPTDATRNEYDPTNPGPYERTVETEVVEKTNESSHTAYGETSNGTLTFDGLSSGTYILTETAAPDGYNLLDSPITIEVEFDSDTGTFSVKSISGLADNNVSFDENGELVITVLNSTGSELPSTGGIGTTIFYIIGGVLVAGAVVVLITRRRVNSAN